MTEPSTSLQVPAREYQIEYVVKKSRFIARLEPVSNRQEVNAAVAQARSDYPDARHHCWAYLLGRPADATNAGMSDDGEPAGTAGKPILNVLQHGHLGDVLVIVIRYFGGIKLGAGGLVRAYGTATQQALETAPFQVRRELVQVLVCGGFSSEQPLRHYLGGIDGVVDDVSYNDGIAMHISLAQEQLTGLRDFCGAHSLAINSAV